MSEEQWEEITDSQHMLRPGVDQIRRREYYATKGQWGEWTPWEFVVVGRTVETAIAGFLSYSFEFRKPKPQQPQQPEAEQAATVDRGVRYRRRIHQTIDGVGYGNSIVADIADIVEAFNMPYMLAQAAKKIMLPGERGSKDRLKDLREAAWHINRQIQIEEAKGNGTV